MENNKKSMFSLSTLLVIAIVAGFSYFVYNINSKPTDNEVKNIAAQYGVNSIRNTDQIKIIKNYSKDGKVIYILNIKNSICEMPMLEIDKRWTSLGINCRG